MPSERERWVHERPPGLAPRVAVTIVAILGWLVFVILWLFFWAGNYNGYQNLAIFLVSVLVLAAILAPMWVFWGMEQGYKYRMGRHAWRDWNRPEPKRRRGRPRSRRTRRG